MKLSSQLLTAFLLIGLLFLWNKLTCLHCPDPIPSSGGVGPFSYTSDIGTMQQCAIHGENLPITRAYVMVGWQVNIYIPFLGCFANDPTPIDLRIGPIKATITGWFKGWHRVPMLNLHFSG